MDLKVYHNIKNNLLNHEYLTGFTTKEKQKFVRQTTTIFGKMNFYLNETKGI